MNTSGLATVGAPNVPQGTMDQVAFFQWIRNTLVALQEAVLPPATPTNVRATGLAGSIQVDFTRSDGDGYILYWNTVPSINGSVTIDLGTANKYVDNIGDNAIKRFYTIQARKTSILGTPSAWVSATSLALTSTVTPPKPPVASDIAVTDQQIDALVSQVSNNGGYAPA